VIVSRRLGAILTDSVAQAGGGAEKGGLPFITQFAGNEVVKAIKPPYSRSSILIRTGFSETAAYLEDGAIDLLHVEGLHTEEAVRSDVERWLPRLSMRGRKCYCMT
jgi:hypothetical protein